MDRGGDDSRQDPCDGEFGALVRVGYQQDGGGDLGDVGLEEVGEVHFEGWMGRTCSEAAGMLWNSRAEGDVGAGSRGDVRCSLCEVGKFACPGAVAVYVS